MMKNLQKLILATIICILGTGVNFAYADVVLNPASGCSVAGTASATEDSVCYNITVTLSLSGYLGTIFQWQSFDGTNWVDETGPGATTDSYDVSLLATTDFRAIVTESSCPSDTSNIVTINVGTIPMPSAAPVTRCGPGIVNLVGTGAGDLEWYDSDIGGNLVASGANTTAFIPASTTLYLEDKVLGGGGVAGPIEITEVDLGSNDDLEIQNVSPTPIDVTGWKVAVSDSYGNINAVNVNVQTLSGILQPGDIITYTDATAGPNYWGNNILWNPGAYPTYTGWALIIDDQNNPVDFVVWNWLDNDIQNMAITINGVSVSPQTIWSGDGINATSVAATQSLSRSGNSDNDVASDFVVIPLSLNSTNPPMVLPFTGFGCNSPRLPVQVNITTSDPVTINASSTTFCLNGSATLTASSNNSNYVYTWSPSAGLNTTTGATVICTPPGPGTNTYVVIGDDGTCSNVDTVTIEVGEPTTAGTASTYLDTICSGQDTDLLLLGSVGNIQWQSFDGTNWINETGPGANSAVYNIAPTMDMTYRAYVSSGSCPPDSSNIVDIAVLSITDPITNDTSVCGSGNVTLTASGQGTLNWYTSPTSPLPVNSGTSYNVTASTTTTYYVESLVGNEYHIGALNSGIGNQVTNASNNWSLGFNVTRPVTIDYVHVYPGQTGNVTINLRQSVGGTILDTHTEPVTAFTGKTAIPVNFDVPVGSGYVLEVAAGGVTLTYNTTGAVYPYTVPNGPLSIVNYYNPTNPATGGNYLYLYDWIVTEGCRSNRIPATVTVNAFPAIPVITQNWNNLDSSSPIGNQWFLNGVAIPGATNNSLTITQVGNYTVSVTINGCTTMSAVFQVTNVGVDELTESKINVYPNPVSNLLNIDLSNTNEIIRSISITDIAGKVVYNVSATDKSLNTLTQINTSDLKQGIYIIELNTQSTVLRKRIALER